MKGRPNLLALDRPFRARCSCGIFPQGDALGFLGAPLWGYRLAAEFVETLYRFTVVTSLRLVEFSELLRRGGRARGRT